MLEKIASIVVGLVVPLVYSTLSFTLNKVSSDKENFEPKKFGKTILIGAFLTSLAMAAGIDVTAVETMTTSGLVTILIDKVLNKC